MNTLHFIHTRSMLLFVALACSFTVLFSACDDDNGTGAEGVELTSLQPVRGEAGDTVRIHGVGFHAQPGQNEVYFNGQQAEVDAANDDGTQLTVLVPSSATTGPVSVSAGDGLSQGGLYFSVIQPGPEPGAAPRQVYWAGQTRSGQYVVKTTYMEGGAPTTETVYTMDEGFQAAAGVALDLDGGTIYISDPEGGYIGQAPLDGSGPVDTLYAGSEEGVTEPEYLALDTQNNYLYWSDTDRIMRGVLNPDEGTVGDTIYTTLTTPSATNESAGLLLDVPNNNLYWTERGSEDRVQLGTLDGAALATTLYGPADAQPELEYIWNMAVDPESGRIYVSDRNSSHYSRIMMGDSEGSGFLKTVLYGAEEGVALSPLAVDNQDDYLYWSQTIPTDPLTRIMRAPLMEQGVPGEVEVAFDNAALDDIEVIYSIALGAGETAAKRKGGNGGSPVQLYFQ